MVYALRLSDAEYAAFLEATSRGATFSQPVERGRSADEFVLIQTREQFTHAATGSYGRRTLLLRAVRKLPRPIPLLELPEKIPRRLQAHALRVFHAGGRLPPKTAAAIREALKRTLAR